MKNTKLQQTYKELFYVNPLIHETKMRFGSPMLGERNLCNCHRRREGKC